MRKKKKYVAALLLLIVPLSVATGTIFSDLETSSTDFTAGTLDSKIGWTETLNHEPVESREPENDPPAIFDFENLQPGDHGSALITVDTSSNPHWLKLRINQTGAYGKAFYQLDFAEGEVIQNLSEDNLYGSRNLKAVHDNTFDSDRELNFGSSCLEGASIDLINSDNYAIANFTLKESCAPKKYTFASYNKLSGGGWKPDEAANQTLFDYSTEEFDAGEHSVKIQLPETPHSSNGVQLEEELEFLVWQDDGDGIHDSTENVLANGTASDINQELGDGIVLDSVPGNSIDAFPSGEAQLGIRWSIDNTCEVVGEAKVFDIGFFSSQERNNPDREDLLFHDSEESSGNTFSVGEEVSCGTEVCQDSRVLSHSPEEEISLEKETAEGQEEVVYTTEIRDGTIKFDQTGGDPLGEDGNEESQEFIVNTEEAGNPSFRLKAGPDTPEKHSLENGEPVEVMDGAFTVELVEKIDEGGEQEFQVKVTSDSEGGSESPALSFVEFNFCGEFPQFRGSGDKGEKEKNESGEKGKSDARGRR